MLVHICCSVDSHFFLQELKKIYPNEELIGFFYDPNIHPYSEYKLRYLDVKRSCKKLHIKLIKGKYDYNAWIDAVRGYENEPEKGQRCSICFDNRLQESAKKALELDEKTITTTLLTSPKKSISQLQHQAQEVQNKYGIKVITPDFRKNGGTSRQFEMAKKDMLYHQNYCGCLYALQKQRNAQKRLEDELCSPLNRQILPSSIEDRIKLYKKVSSLEQKNQPFRLKREKFLNYRLISSWVKIDHQIVPSYPLCYSFLKKEQTKGEVVFQKNGVGELNRESVIFIDLQCFNRLAKKRFSSVKELNFSSIKVKDEIKIRQKISKNPYSLFPIIVIDAIPCKKVEIALKSVIYEDIRELLVKTR